MRTWIVVWIGVTLLLPLLLARLGTAPQPLRDPCELDIVVSDEAERLNGGAHYLLNDGPYCKSPLRIAHDDHAARYGGTFYMAPNGVHHVEFRYTERCGAQVVLYNAYTQELHAADQLVGLVRVMPDDESDRVRDYFLQPSARGVVLGADIGPVKRPFELQFLLQFPFRPEPDRFNVFVGK
jgi:hypothetical protein